MEMVGNVKVAMAISAALVVSLGAGGYAKAGVALIGPATFTYYAGSEPTPIPDPYTGYNYGNYTETAGSGITFTGAPFLTDSGVNGISEMRDLSGTDTDPNWPDGSSVFAADITASITAPTAGNYTFGFGSDDAGYVFINGNLISSVSESGPSGFPGLQLFSVPLSAGANNLEIQYDNIYGGGAVVDFQAVPEAATWAMMLLGVGVMGAALRGRRMKEPLAAG
jgi:hypothetical protein